MIVRLRGKLLGNEPPAITVEVGGIGYEVWLPGSAFAALPALGKELVVHTVTVVRPDSNLLYGFGSAAERSMFQALLRISGVGAKVALSLLSSLGVDALANAVEAGDAKAIAKAQGIGRRTAERILIELRGSKVLLAAPATVPVVSKAIEALVALGFPASRARAALIGLKAADKNAGALVKEALKELAPPS